MMKKRKSPGSVTSGQKQPRMDAADEDGGMRWAGRRPVRSSATGPPAPEAGLAMTMPHNVQQARTRGRLNRAVLAMLGKGLEDCFEEVRKQEVPERFKLLLKRF
jgi:hypothetical protein